jgi:hypothetical protein
MATNFPTSLDSLTNPTSSDSLASPSHAAQHANVNDAVEALQAKVGVDGSAVTSSLDYQLNAIGTWTDYSGSVSYGNVTVGNGSTNYALYVQLNDLVIVQVQFTLGSTSAVTGLVDISLPVTADEPGGEPQVTMGFGRVFDASTSSVYWITPYTVGSTAARLYVSNASSTYAFRSNISSTVPISWTTGDSFQVMMMYKAA